MTTTLLTSKSSMLSDHLRHNPLAIGIGAGDALQAKLIELAGFDFIWISSLAVSASLAMPEAVCLASDKFRTRCAEITQAVSIPTVIDSNLSHLSIINVAEAIRSYISIGVAAISIEDKASPKTNSLDVHSIQPLMPADAFMRIIDVASRASSGQALIIARVEALIAGRGRNEALRRMRAYAEAGADVIIVHSRSPDPEEVVDIVRSWDGPCPLCLIPTTYPTLTEERMLSLRKIKMVVYANHMVRVAVKAQQQLLAEIKQARGIHTVIDELVPVERIFELQSNISRSS